MNKPIRRRKKRAPPCTWCGKITCDHCRCVGYSKCNHAPGSLCSRTRYDRRLVCNPCEKKKLHDHRCLESGKPLPPWKVSRRTPTPPVNPSIITTNTTTTNTTTNTNTNTTITTTTTTEAEQLAKLREISSSNRSEDTLEDILFNDTSPTSTSTATVTNTTTVMSNEDISMMNDLFENDVLSGVAAAMLPPLPLEYNCLFDSEMERGNKTLFIRGDSLLSSDDDEHNSFNIIRTDSLGSFLDKETNGSVVLTGGGGSSNETIFSDDDLFEYFPAPSNSTATTFDNEGPTASTEISNNKHSFIHVNVKLNSTPFGVIPVDRDIDNLLYIREYVQNKLWDQINGSRFSFLDSFGMEIPFSQEEEFNAWRTSEQQVTTHHTFGSEVMRNHVFISLATPVVQNRKRKRNVPGSGDSDDDEDKDDDDETERDIKKNKTIEYFKSASTEVQDSLVWDFYLSGLHGNSYNVSTSEILLNVMIERNMNAHILSLLRCGADVNRVDKSGNTALHIAAIVGNLVALKLLLVQSFHIARLAGTPDMWKKNNDGKIPIDVAKSDVSRLFLQSQMDRFVPVSMKASDIRRRTLSQVRTYVANTTMDGKTTNNASIEAKEAVSELDFVFLIQGTPVFQKQESEIYAMDATGKGRLVLCTKNLTVKESKVEADLAEATESTANLSLDESNNKIISTNTKHDGNLKTINVTERVFSFQPPRKVVVSWASAASSRSKASTDNEE